MVELVVAHFDTQFAASAAAEKLLSIGISREQVVVTFGESIGRIPSTSSAPSSVVSRVSHTGTTATSEEPNAQRLSPSARGPARHVDPALIGHATVVVELRGELSMDEVRQLLEHAGGHAVDARHQTAQHEEPAMWPSHGHASKQDVERSVRAAKGGLGLQAPRKH